MSLTTTQRRNDYLGNGSTATYSYTFKIFDATHLEVIRTNTTTGVETTLVYPTNYSVTGVGRAAGGFITLTAGVLATGQKLSIIRKIPLTQPTDLRNLGGYFPDTTEDELDRRGMIDLQQQDQIDRSIKVPRSTDLSAISTELPKPEANKVPMWNDTATALVNRSASDLVTVTGFSNWRTDTFNGTGAQTTFTLTADPGNVNNMDVSVDGITMTPGVDFSVSGTTLTFLTGAPPVGTNNVCARYGFALPQAIVDAGSVNFIQSGMGAVARTVQAKLRDYVNVKDYGATGLGVADDTTAVSNCLADHLNVYFPPGTYNCGQLTLRTGHNIIGAGREATTVRLRNTSNSALFHGNSVNNIRISGMTLDGNKTNNLTAGTGVAIIGASSDIYIDNVYSKDFQDGLGFAGTTTRVSITNCTVENNTRDGCQFTGVTRATVLGNVIRTNGRFGVIFGAGCDYARLIGNLLSGNSATDGSGGGAAAISCTDVLFSSNTAEGNTLGHGLQFNTITRGVMAANVSRDNGISGLDLFATVLVTLSGNVSFNNSIRGIEVDSASFYNTICNNIVQRNAGAGISVYRSPGTIVQGNFCTENGNGAIGEKFGIRLWDNVNTLPSGNCRLIGNTCTDDRGGSATQTHGISIEAASTTGTIVYGNNLSPNTTGAISYVVGSIARARDNNGWVTQNEGVATIASGTTSIVVTHGLASTPSINNIYLAASNAGTNDPGDIWISGITSTQFTINCRFNPGAGGITFGWRASIW